MRWSVTRSRGTGRLKLLFTLYNVVQRPQCEGTAVVGAAGPLLNHIEVAGKFAVVAREEDRRVVGEARLVDAAQQLAEDPACVRDQARPLQSLLEHEYLLVLPRVAVLNPQRGCLVRALKPTLHGTVRPHSCEQGPVR